MPDRSGTRVARTAAIAATAAQETIHQRLGAVRVLVELESRDVDAVTCLYAAVRQAILMWTSVTVSLPANSADLEARCRQIADELRPGQSSVQSDPRPRRGDFDGVLHIGAAAFSDPRVVSVTSTGWVMHVFAAATVGPGSPGRLPSRGPRNGLAAIGVSTLGLGEVFLRTLGLVRTLASFDLSLFDYAYGPLGSLLDLGPNLPRAFDMAGLLVGAGTVGASFAFALSPIDLRGWLGVVDYDAARSQNFGPHPYVSTVTNGTPKVKLVEAHLKADHPGLEVIAKAERLRLFRYRLGAGVPHPDVVISGLDKARPRQEAQRLWAPLHIDMATKDGLQIQVIVRSVPGTGLCLIRRFPIGDEEDEEAEISRRTGLTITAVQDGLADITEEDVANAAEDRRADLAAARSRGERRCNVITRGDLGEDDDSDGYLGSAPFTAVFAGTVGAAELIKTRGLGLDRDGAFILWHFVSRNLFIDRTRCADNCECAAHGWV